MSKDMRHYASENDFEFKIIDGGTAIKITKYTGSNSDVRIPPRIRYLPVTVIGDEAFGDKSLVSGFPLLYPIDDGTPKNYLTGVTIPDTVILIGEGAFKDNLLTGVIIPNGVVHI